MKKRSFVQYSIGLLLGLALAGCSQTVRDTTEGEAGNENSITLDDELFTSIGIESGNPEKRTMRSFLTVNGMLDAPPQNLVSVSAPMGGFIRSTPLLQGMFVRKGQALVELEDPAYILLQQEYLENVSQLEFVKAEYERQLTLARENVNSQKSLQEAKARHDALIAKVNGLKARLALINIDASALTGETIQRSIRLYSPLNGFVTQVHINLGQYVNSTDVLFKIVDNSHLHAELYVFEQDIHHLKVDQPVHFNLIGESKERLARIHLIGREIGEDRTVRIHCHLDQEDQNLMPGMYIKARIEVTTEETLAVPESAVVNFEGTYYVFATADNKNFRMTKVTTGNATEGFVTIHFVEGTIPERIVLKGAYELLSKMKNTEEE